MKKGFVSIIIRTKNEERWIKLCLDAVFNQDYKDFEVIVVDNDSTDKTLEKIKNYDVKLCSFSETFSPGKALNHGIKEGEGEFVVCLSGHCVPTNSSWLSNLVRNFDDPDVAGVYGRQEPLSFTSDVDKRDMINTFRSQRIVQTKDSFFHNANSMVRRSVLDKIPFDEDVTNIEDRLWGKAVIEHGLKLVYEPEASVYHHHGIHQNNDGVRCSNVVKILEDMEIVKRKDSFRDADLNIIALVPIKKDNKTVYTQELIDYTIMRLKDVSRIKDVYVITDDQKIAEQAKRAGATIPFLRPEELSSSYMNLSDVLHYALERLETNGIIADLVIAATITYPFRPEGFFDTLIDEIIVSGMDTVVATHPEYRLSWKNNNRELERINDFMPRQFKDPVEVGMVGLGFVTHPFKIRANEIFTGRIGISEVHDQLAAIEIHDRRDHEIFMKLTDQAVIKK